MLRKVITFVSVLIVFVAIAGWFLRPSFIYSVMVTADGFPSNDQALESWMKSYPQVVSRTVSVERDDRRLTVIFVQNRNLWGFPAFPPLEEKCSELGYDLGGARFEDSTD